MLLVIQSVHAQQPAQELVLYNGKIVTVDDPGFTSRLGTIAQAMHVRDGHWSSVMPHTFLHVFGVPADMRAIPLVDPAPTHEIGLVIADREPAPPIAQALMQAVRKRKLQAILDKAVARPLAR